jgi:hypothetical protein
MEAELAGSSFKPEVKEREHGQPCFIMLNADRDIGLGNKQIIFDLPEGTGIEQAQQLARVLSDFRIRVRVA